MYYKKEYKNIAIDELESMTDYQRPIDMKFVEEKSKPGVFDKDAVECPKVSVRNDGSKKMGDGQHTVAIVRRVGWKFIRCELRYGLTEQEENDWFAQENTKRQPQSNKRILTAKINGTRSKNMEEQEFNDCIKSLNFKLDIYGESSGSDYKIRCTSSLFKLYKEYTVVGRKNDFVECMDLHRTAFRGDPVSMQWSYISGLFEFFNAYNYDFDRRRFVDVFSRLSPLDLKKEAETDKYTKKTSTKYAKLFVDKYNYKLPKKRQLKMSKLDD